MGHDAVGQRSRNREGLLEGTDQAVPKLSGHAGRNGEKRTMKQICKFEEGSVKLGRRPRNNGQCYGSTGLWWPKHPGG